MAIKTTILITILIVIIVFVSAGQSQRYLNGLSPNDAHDEDVTPRFMETVKPFKKGNTCKIRDKADCTYRKSPMDVCCFQYKRNLDGNGGVPEEHVEDKGDRVKGYIRTVRPHDSGNMCTEKIQCKLNKFNRKDRKRPNRPQCCFQIKINQGSSPNKGREGDRDGNSGGESRDRYKN